MAFQINLGRTPSDSGEHTMWSVTALGKNRIKALGGGEGFGGGTDETRVLEALDEEGPMPVSDLASRIHMGTGKVRREISRLAKMGCVRQASGGGE